MKFIFKFPTGVEIPEGAVYLSTVTQTSFEKPGDDYNYPKWVPCWVVWHYFLVEVPE